MSKYASGARFERQIIHYLLKKGAVLVMRGAGSKSYGKIKADIVAIFTYSMIPNMPNRQVLIIQAKHSRRSQKKARQEFEDAVLAIGMIPLWLDQREDWKRKILASNIGGMD